LLRFSEVNYLSFIIFRYFYFLIAIYNSSHYDRRVKSTWKIIIMKLTKLAFICSMIMTITGCASIAGNNTRAVTVHSVPEGAAIYVDNQEYGVTPATITLPNNIYGGKSIMVKKAGYHEQTRMVNTQFQPVALLDIFLWPTFIIDGVTGNLVKIDPATSNLYYRLQRA
jgi:hypothetical protein